jgi:hypothetical protein
LHESWKTSSAHGNAEPADELELDFGDRMIMLLTAAYPNAQSFGDEELGETAHSLYHDELMDMRRRYDEVRVEASIRKWIRTSEHLPRISQIRDGIDENLNARSRYDPHCGECSGTGFRYLPAAPGEPVRTAKCNCHERVEKQA